MRRPSPSLVLVAALALLVAAPATAQIRTVDPNAAGADLAPVPADEAGYGTDMPVERVPEVPVDEPASEPPATPPATATAAPPPAQGDTAASVAAQTGTFTGSEVLAGAEEVFGKGAEGLAKLIEKVLRDQGQPNAYIGGREAGGAFAVGLRYGSGVLHHRVEGDRPVYWNGPSIGFDVGGNGAKTFVLVYNLYDTQELFRSYPAAEGNVYVVGGFTASYLRRGDVVLIPIRLGVGWRLGANVGYMRFTEKARILPF